MRKYGDSIVHSYLTDGSAWRVRWRFNFQRSNSRGRECYDVFLDVRKGKRGEWKQIFDSWCSPGMVKRVEKDMHGLYIACAAYPGTDEDGEELRHPGKAYPGLLDSLDIESMLLEESA